MPGKRITDQQTRRYMDLRSKHDQATAAAKAGISVASARRIEVDPRPRLQKERAAPLAHARRSRSQACGRARSCRC